MWLFLLLAYCIVVLADDTQSAPEEGLVWANTKPLSLLTLSAPEIHHIKETSNGQAIWYLENVAKQIEEYDKRFGIKEDRTRTFVEFGARDGVFESNTLVLEVQLHWQGLLVEAGQNYINNLQKNRRCKLNGHGDACVFAALDSIANETLYWTNSDSVVKEKPLDNDSAVQTTTIQSLFDKYDVKHVDFLSADCEGCESKALSTLDFTKTQVDVINIEHAFQHCDVAKMLTKLNYTLFPLNFVYDSVFISPAALAKMANPPINHCPKAACEGDESMHSSKGKVKTMQAVCLEVHPVTWMPGDPWPPRH